MVALALGAVGSAIGAGFGGTILGLSGAVIGGAVGTFVGTAVDSWLIASLAPGQRQEGQRLDNLRVTTASEGGVIPRVYGRARIGGNVIWATDFTEEVVTDRQGGGKGRGPRITTTTYLYSASFAVALCEGRITGIGRIWADGQLLDLEGVTWRWYPGNEAQVPDPLIASRMGADTPAYRGTAYVVFQDFAVEKFGNRIPQLTFEVFRPLAEPDTAEGLLRAVTLIPASGEFTYSTVETSKENEGETSSVNVNALAGTPDLVVSLDQLEAAAPAVESVSVVVAWFGDDLRCGVCKVRPGVETIDKVTEPVEWLVNGVERAEARVVSQIGGRPVYGGTPSDLSVVECIRDLKARGLRVTFYPFILMDVPPGNTLPDPYSNGAGGVGQPAFPWRGRITCSPAAGFSGTADKTATAASQVDAFFGSAAPGDFTVDGTEVEFTGAPADWGVARMILHYAHLCAAAGGVDAFLIGTEMRGLSTIRSGASAYPAVARYVALAAQVRSIVGAGTKISYAADWSEYFGHIPGDGSGDVHFHLDPLWASTNVDFIGIDNYQPLSDWRDGFTHLDALGAPSIYDRGYLQSNIEGGEGFDWFYASDAARASQTRTPITDGGAGKPWVFRYKDIRSWWLNQHFNRPGGVESGTATAWVPQSKPFWFTEFGCPCVDRGTNQPNVFFDPKSSESFVPYFSRGWRDDAIARAYLEAVLLYWANPLRNPVSGVYGGRMLNVAECAAWTWDARPYPQFPAREDVWSDGANWRLGHWLGGRLGSASLGALVRDACRRSGMPDNRIDVSDLSGAVEGYVVAAIESARATVSTLGSVFGFDAVETQGVIRFVMRGRGPAGSVDADSVVRTGDEPFELIRAQETELPRVLKWQFTRADEEYDMASVEAFRGVVDSARVQSESFGMILAPEEAERWCRRSLQERWIGRETATLTVPPSRLALDPGDVLALQHDGRAIDFRIVSVADGENRRLELVRADREVYDLPPGAQRASSLARPVVFGRTDGVFMDLPQLREVDPPHHPRVAAIASPWPGTIAVFRSPELDDFELQRTFQGRVRHGILAAALGAGPLDLFDIGNEILVDMRHGQLVSVSEAQLLAGRNGFALETPAGWEIVQAQTATLVSPGRYRLTRLLRGQRGTEDGMVASLAAGARIFMLDGGGVAPLDIELSDLGLAYNWRVGPANRPVGSRLYDAEVFTPRGRGLRPFSVAHVQHPADVAWAGGDLTLRWIRRDRALAADGWDAVSIPMSEVREAYEVEILSGSTVLRVLEASVAAVVYTAAAQAADFGAALAPGGTLRVRIFQMSEVVGRGVPRTALLNL